MQHKPKFNTLITPCCMILKFWILLVQHICPLDHSINIAGRIIKNGEGKTPAEIAPGTKVHELVEELAKYLPEEMQRKFKEN